MHSHHVWAASVLSPLGGPLPLLHQLPFYSLPRFVGLMVKLQSEALESVRLEWHRYSEMKGVFEL